MAAISPSCNVLMGTETTNSLPSDLLEKQLEVLERFRELLVAVHTRYTTALLDTPVVKQRTKDLLQMDFRSQGYTIFCGFEETRRLITGLVTHMVRFNDTAKYSRELEWHKLMKKGEEALENLLLAMTKVERKKDDFIVLSLSAKTERLENPAEGGRGTSNRASYNRKKAKNILDGVEPWKEIEKWREIGMEAFSKWQYENPEGGGTDGWVRSLGLNNLDKGCNQRNCRKVY